MEILDAILTQLLSALPIVAAVTATLVIDFVRNRVGDVVPRAMYPILLPLAGAVVAGVAKGVGADIGDFNPSTVDLSMWETVVAGALTGSATVGLKEARKSLTRLREPIDDDIDFDGPHA